MQTAPLRAPPSPRVEKALWIALLLIAYGGYPLIGLHQDGARGSSLATGIDASIPFSPRWMFVYAALYPMLLLPCVAIVDIGLLRRVSRAYLFAFAVAFGTFLVFPVTTAAFRPRVDWLPVSTFWGWGVALNYTFDPPLNCFPSLHVTTSALAALAMRKVDVRLFAASTVVAALIAASTMLVKQHYIADVFAGVALAMLADRLFVARYTSSPPASRLRARSVACALFYGAMLTALYALFAHGYRPWDEGALATKGGAPLSRAEPRPSLN